MKRAVPAALALALALAACDIDFVSLDETAPDIIDVNATHAAVLAATVRVESAPRDGASARVESQSTERSTSRYGSALYRATVGVDSLDPVVDVLTDAFGDGPPRAFRIPVLARRGPALRRADGRLELPVLAPGGFADPDPFVSWEVLLLDERGVRLLEVSGSDRPLPDPLVLDAALVPEAATRAAVSRVLVGRDESAAPAVLLFVRSSVFFDLDASR